MKTRRARILCLFLSVCILLGLSPIPISAQETSPGNVIYKRLSPEVALLNTQTGGSTTFYQSLKKNYGKDDCRYTEYYNGFCLFHGGDYKTTDYKTRITDDKTGTDGGKLYFGGTENGYGKSVLRTVSKKRNNLFANLSATLYNRVHSHSVGFLRSQDVLAYETVYLYMSGDYKSRLYGSLAGMAVKISRQNDFSDFSDPYKSIYYTEASHGERAYISFEKSSVQYKTGTCTCGGAYAENMLVTFRDSSAPALEDISYSLDGGATWEKHSKKLYVGNGDTLRIRLTYDEPIRFADDSAAHDDLYLSLTADGAAEGSGPKAYLTELSGKTLIFTYKMTGKEGLMNVSSVSLSSLFKENLPLKQVVKDSSFTLTESNMGDPFGFSTTNAYITDLAGNPIYEKNYLTSLVLDTEAPYVSNVLFEGDTVNSDVKEALGDDLNLSDTHLGEGDSLRITVDLNEEITLTKNGVQKWEHATFVTNLLLTDGKPNSFLGDRLMSGLGTKTVGEDVYLTVKSNYLYAYDGNTRLYGSTVPIHSNMKAVNLLGYENGDGMIYVTAVEFDDGTDITDYAGNAYEGKISSTANSGAYYLDVTPPTVSTSGTVKVNDGFRLGFTIEDTGTAASGMQGIYGDLSLTNGGDGKAYEFEYVINASPETPTDNWKTAFFGDDCRFVQVASGNYLHIRPKSGVLYGDVSNCTVTVKAKDLAGNRSEIDLPVNDAENNWSLDGIAPVAEIKEITRALSGNGGIITVTITLSDNGGLSDAYYSTDGGDTWNPLSLIEGATEAETTATLTVADKERFEKEFSVRVSDLSSNEKIHSFGKIVYDLSEAQYSLRYPDDYTDRAEVYVTDLSEEDTLVFLVELPESAVGKPNRYAAYTATVADGLASDENLFSRTGSVKNNGWYLVSLERTVTESGAVRYVFDADEDYRFWDNTDYRPTIVTSTTAPSSLRDFWSSLLGKNFSGNLNVTVLSGKRDAFTRWPNAVGTVTQTERSIQSAGNDIQSISESHFTLRVCGYTLTPYTPNLRPENEAALSISHGSFYFDSKKNPFMLSTLAGTNFILTIPNDSYGWNYGPLDYKNSYILLENKAKNPVVSYKVPIGPIVPDADDPTRSTQVITVPELGFDSGIYEATLYLAARVGTDYTTWLKDSEGNFFRGIAVDTSEPNNDFYLSSTTFTPEINTLSVYDGLELYGYETRECSEENGVYYWPLYRNLFGTFSGMRTLTFNTDGEKATALSTDYDRCYTGSYSINIWNTDPELSSCVYRESSSDEDFSSIECSDARYIKVFRVISSASEATDEDCLYLYSGKVNTIAVQKVYANGKRSVIKKYQICPDDRFLDGKASASVENGGQLIFTPSEDSDTESAVFYAYFFNLDKTDDRFCPEKTVTLEPYPDGTWRCALSENGSDYQVVGINKHGTVSVPVDGRIYVNAPWFDQNGVSLTDEGNGLYSLSFTLRDDRGDIENTPPEITLSFDENYRALLGSDSFTFTPVYDLYGRYHWVTEKESPTGIYEITATHGTGEIYANLDGRYDYLTVTVKAVCAYDGQNNTQPITATVTATDRFGLTVQASAAETVSAVPAVSSGFRYTPNALTANFTQPIRPVASWAWQEKDDDGKYFSTQWINAFPISGNGTYTIEYRDLFGVLRSETVTLTDTYTLNGVDYGLDLSFSSTVKTTDSVVVTAAAKDGGQLIVWEREGDENRYTTVAPIGGYPGRSTEERSTEFSENTEILIVRYNKPYDKNDGPWSGYRTRVYITDIVNAAPAASVLYYLESAGQEFTYDELQEYITRYGKNGTMNSDGNVTVRYYTDRNVTPTENSGVEFIFRKGSERSHRFTYTDDFGNHGSVTAVLPSGLLLTDPPAPRMDESAPIVTAGIYAKRFGSYMSADSFLAEEDENTVLSRFMGIGAAQGFLLKLDVRDESAYTIDISETDGALLTGNSVTIRKPCDFTVTTTDAAGNKTVFSISAAMLSAIDTVSPTAQTEVVSIGLYEKDGYIRPYDVDENGNELTGAGHEITLSEPKNAAKVVRSDGKEWYKLSFTDNGSVEFVFRDEVGNYGKATLTVSGIDTSHPVLSIRWSPSYTYEQDGILRYDDAFPTQNTVSGAITAHITGDVPLKNVILESDSFNATLLPDDGTEVPLGTDTGLSAQYSPERITVTYNKDFEQTVTLTAFGPNGKESSVVLNGFSGRIDRESPVITETKTPLIKNGSSVPYGYLITLAPNESAYSQNYGAFSENGQPTYYDAQNPLTLTVAKDEEFTVFFSDKAGNITAHTVTVSGIDLTAPSLTLRYPDGNPNLLRPTNEPVSLYVTADEDCTLSIGEKTYSLSKDIEKELSFTENGTFILSVSDKAGNRNEYTVTIHCIDRGVPSLRFDTNFVYLAEDSAEEELDALLQKGYTAWDNTETAGYPVVRYDKTDVDLHTAGSYTVPYTVTDAAGNTFETLRFVNVVGKNTLCVYINGKLILPEGTAVIEKGENLLTVQNLENILPGEYEPHTVKICKGILSLGQMKKYSQNALSVAADGSFRADKTGFYTVLVTTQSRRTVRITLYLEK